jgi:hypothetical protein
MISGIVRQNGAAGCVSGMAQFCLQEQADDKCRPHTEFEIPKKIPMLVSPGQLLSYME